jgi:acetyl esterase/lipase
VKALACVLLFFHGGGFVAGDATAPADVVAAAPPKCLVVGVPYTLGNLGAAWRDSRDAAKRGRQKHRRVLAYGESAGAAIAARLAQEGLADATAAFVPPADLWAGIKQPAVQQMIDSTGASDAERWQLSPAMHSSRRPVLVQIMRQDLLLNTDAQWSWVDRDPRVEGQQVEGTHVWPVEAADRATQLTSAMAFLKWTQRQGTSSSGIVHAVSRTPWGKAAVP